MSAPLEICQIELRVRDLAAAIRFYRDVFAWSVAPAGATSAVLDAGAPPVIGITAAGGLPLGVGAYCLTNDLEATTRRVDELGGRIVIRGDAGGRFAGTLDPWGNELFFRQRTGALPGHRDTRANPFVFVELAVANLAAAESYYEKLCGWSFWSPVSTIGGFAIAEGCGLAVGIGVAFSKLIGTTCYVEVDDIEATLTQLTTREIRTSPLGAFPGGGRFAMFLDPDGNRVGLYEPPRS